MNNEKVILLSVEIKDCFGKSYGFRMFDSKGHGFDFLSEKNFENDLDLLKYAWVNHHDIEGSEISRMFDFLKKNLSGIQINNNWYEWDKIKGILVSTTN